MIGHLVHIDLCQMEGQVALCAGTMDAHVAGGADMVNGEQPGVRKRGAKPKYRFITAEEAVAHRCPAAHCWVALHPRCPRTSQTAPAHVTAHVTTTFQRLYGRHVC